MGGESLRVASPHQIKRLEKALLVEYGMEQEFFGEHWNDENGNPGGGGVNWGCGFTISWQNGPLGRGDDRREPNGAFVETIINVVIDRISYYEESQFACRENKRAIAALYDALRFLNDRTASRERRSVKGTHTV